jgi:hypothetical protein
MVSLFSISIVNPITSVLAVSPLYLVVQGPQVVAAPKWGWFALQWLRGNSHLRIGWQ